MEASLTPNMPILIKQIRQFQGIKMFKEGLISQTTFQQRNAAMQNSLAKKTKNVPKLVIVNLLCKIQI